MGISGFYKVCQRDPLEQYSKTMKKSGGLVQAPKNMTIFGCLRADIAWHSDKKSLKLLKLLFYSILNFLMATVVSRHLPL